MKDPMITLGQLSEISTEDDNFIQADPNEGNSIIEISSNDSSIHCDYAPPKAQK